MHFQKLKTLYEIPLGATRSGALFNAHAYPTKISPESVALLIACHTKPGDLVFDGFGGSGTTALGSLLCSKPSEELKDEANKRGLQPIWGARRAVVYELSGLGSFIASTLCSRPSPARFMLATQRVLAEAERRIGWMYSAMDLDGGGGVARYFIWSDRVKCPACEAIISMWAGCVSLNPARISDEFLCPECGKKCPLDELPRNYESRFDELLGRQVAVRSRTLVRVDGVSGKKQWSREPVAEDFDLFERVQNEAVSGRFPLVPMMGKDHGSWGDLWRSGYHEGMTHVHHFYTRRNFIALAVLHDLVENEPADIRDALKFWVSSYNSSHSTLMTRVVAKSGQDDLALTSAQPGVLYISGLPVEKNVLLGLKRKEKTIAQAFALLRESQGEVKIVQGSSTDTHLDDASVDYVFTDPPFGGNIPYSEVNFIAEAWLDRTTNTKEEAIVSSAQKKAVGDYESLLTKAFSELRRILKPEGKATLAFHSTQSDVWKALVSAYTNAGFSLEFSSILDKKQGSFKQVTASNSVKGDPLILLRPGLRKTPIATIEPRNVIRDLLSVADECRANEPDEGTSQRLYSRFVEHYLKRHHAPPIDASQFYSELALVQSLR